MPFSEWPEVPDMTEGSSLSPGRGGGSGGSRPLRDPLWLDRGLEEVWDAGREGGSETAPSSSSGGGWGTSFSAREPDAEVAAGNDDLNKLSAPNDGNLFLHLGYNNDLDKGTQTKRKHSKTNAFFVPNSENTVKLLLF